MNKRLFIVFFSTFQIYAASSKVSNNGRKQMSALDRSLQQLLVRMDESGNRRVYQKNREEIMGLVCAKADPNLEWGERSVLSRCIPENDLMAVACLLECKADPNACKFILASADCPEMIQVLLARGADLNCREDGGDTILHHAIRRDMNGETFEELCKSGLDVNTVNEQGNTPLHSSLMLTGCLRTSYTLNRIRSLARFGADITIENKSGRTPMEELKQINPELAPEVTQAILEGMIVCPQLAPTVIKAFITVMVKSKMGDQEKLGALVEEYWGELGGHG